jgi:hypothetical protein
MARDHQRRLQTDQAGADLAEFDKARWWSPSEIRAADSSRFDPHQLRFMRKLSL